jgi:hypothetical protein
MPRRTLSLKREALLELTPADLAGVAGGKISDVTCISCMTFISCYITDCIARDTVLCIE